MANYVSPETMFNQKINDLSSGTVHADYISYHGICGQARELVYNEQRDNWIEDLDWDQIWQNWHPSVFDALDEIFFRTACSAREFAEFVEGAPNEEIWTVLYNHLITDLSNFIEDNKDELTI